MGKLDEKPEPEVLDQLDGHFVVRGHEMEGLILAACPVCKDIHVELGHFDGDLQFVRTPCQLAGLLVYTGEREFIPVREQLWQVDITDDGKVVLLGFEEDGRLKVRCCYCDGVHDCGPIDDYDPSEQRTQLSDCPEQGVYVVEAPSDMPVVDARLEHGEFDQLVVSNCLVCGGTHRHAADGAEIGDLTVRTSDCDLPDDERPDEYRIRVIEEGGTDE